MILCEDKTQNEVLTEVLEKIIGQGGKCTVRFGGRNICCYSDNKGKHCAVGWLLPEDSPLMQSEEMITSLLQDEHELGPNSKWMKENANFLRDLQTLHDTQIPRFKDLELRKNKLISKWIELTN